MVKIEKFVNLEEKGHKSLHKFLKNNEENILPYHIVNFASVIKDTFNYRNFSLVAFDENNCAVGYLPQWKKGNVIESIPWRDKGGPIYNDENILKAFVEETKKIVKELNLKGFIWKDFQTKFLENYKYFVNVEINLTEYTNERYWSKIPSNARRAVKTARKNKLLFQIESQDIHDALQKFYDLFLINRRKLGVPVYPIKLFEAYFRYMPKEQIKMFTVYKDNSPVGSLILLRNRHKAIYAYPASNELGKKLRANDMIIYNVIKYCIENGIKYFDFGADSPLQIGLIKFKLKWLGKRRKIITSFYGKVKEIDHNEPKYNHIKKVIKKMPVSFYILFSKMVVR